jgi:hypothetical protein
VTRSGLSRLFWIGAAAILVVAALLAIAAVVAGNFSSTDGKILLTLGALLLAGTTGFSGLGLLERRVVRGFGRVAIATAGIGFLLIVVTIWTESESLARAAGTAAVAMGALLLAATNRLLVRDERFVPLWGGTVAAASVATALTIVAIWSRDAGSGLGRAIAAFWIICVLGWFLVPVLQRLSKAPADQRAERVLATLDGIDALATTSPAENDLAVDVSAVGRGEQLVLRRRPG